MAKRAFTLVEVLTVIAILVVLMALLFPALVKAERAAIFVEDKSKLRQVSLAHSLYVEAAGMIAPSLEAVVSTQNLPPTLLVSKLDRFEDGMSNAYRRINSLSSDKPRQKVTFFSMHTFRMFPQIFLSEHSQSTNVGYFLWPLAFDNVPENDAIDIQGTYYRVTAEGSLLKRSFAPIAFKGANGAPSTWTNFHFLFSDPDKETETRWSLH